MTGGLLVALGIVMPLIVSVESFRIYPTLVMAIRQQEKIYIIVAALKLVALNSIRCFPHYLGAFFLGESITLEQNGKPVGWSRAVIVCTVIPMVYLMIGWYSGIHYDFGGPAVLLIVLLIMLEKADFSLVNLSKKALMIIMLVAAFQFLDVMPSLAGFPFGRGESSSDIKLMSNFLQADGILQSAALLFFAILLSEGIMLWKLVMDENNIRALNEIKEQNEHMLNEKRMRMLESRTYTELQYLVHDLKTPLTSVQALVGVVKLGCRDDRRQDYEYLSKIESSVERMSTMISEILNENQYTTTTTEHVLSVLLAQISIAEYAPMVMTSNEAPKLVVTVNEIRFVRALVNLLENSFCAVDKTNGIIQLEISCVKQQKKNLRAFYCHRQRWRNFTRHTECNLGKGL